jgi:hypothetical protein
VGDTEVDQILIKLDHKTMNDGYSIFICYSIHLYCIYFLFHWKIYMSLLSNIYMLPHSQKRINIIASGVCVCVRLVIPGDGQRLTYYIQHKYKLGRQNVPYGSMDQPARRRSRNPQRFHFHFCCVVEIIYGGMLYRRINDTYIWGRSNFTW